MPLTQTLTQMMAKTRRLSDTESRTDRHPDADVRDDINRGLAAYYRVVTQALPGQRFMSESTISTVSGTSLYNLSGFSPSAAELYQLLSMEVEYNSHKFWIQAFSLAERPMLTSPDGAFTGVPLTYQIRGTQIELLPEPTGVYTVTMLWVANAPQKDTAGSEDAETIDTICRFDDYAIAYAVREIATKDKNWDLVQAMSARLAELKQEVLEVAMRRDKNSPGGVVDIFGEGRRFRSARRYR